MLCCEIGAKILRLRRTCAASLRMTSRFGGRTRRKIRICRKKMQNCSVVLQNPSVSPYGLPPPFRQGRLWRGIYLADKFQFTVQYADTNRESPMAYRSPSHQRLVTASRRSPTNSIFQNTQLKDLLTANQQVFFTFYSITVSRVTIITMEITIEMEFIVLESPTSSPSSAVNTGTVEPMGLKARITSVCRTSRGKGRR